MEGVLKVSVEAQTIALVIQVTHWTGVAIVWSSAPVDAWMVSVQVLQLLSLLALWLSYIKFPFHLLWSADPLCIYLTFHVHKSFYQFFFQTYKLMKKWLFSVPKRLKPGLRNLWPALYFHQTQQQHLFLFAISQQISNFVLMFVLKCMFCLQLCYSFSQYRH